MTFEWDESKRAENLRKHGVDFADAVGVFFDASALTQPDPDAAGEYRHITLGLDFLARLLLVVWTERSDDVYRIISARPASPGEGKDYRSRR
jgi:uncharacterized protein